MADWTTITPPVAGEATKLQNFALKVIGNLVYLYNNLGGSTGLFVPNASFDSDEDDDGRPDGWGTGTHLTIHPGGTFLLDTVSPGHGTRVVKFTSTGGGGGWIENNDAFPCSPQKFVVVDFLHKSSVADIHNVVYLRWYTEAESFIGSTILYDEDANNPLTFTRFLRSAAPPATARLARVRFEGAKNDDATPGTAWFDGVSVSELPRAYEKAIIPEGSASATGAWTTIGSTTLRLPVLSAGCALALKFSGQVKRTGNSGPGIRFRVGTSYSNQIISPDIETSYEHFEFLIKLPLGTSGSPSGSQTLTMEATAGPATVVFGKVDSVVDVIVYTA
jgi:hypothetical protein